MDQFYRLCMHVSASNTSEINSLCSTFFFFFFFFGIKYGKFAELPGIPTGKYYKVLHHAILWLLFCYNFSVLDFCQFFSYSGVAS